MGVSQTVLVSLPLVKTLSGCGDSVHFTIHLLSVFPLLTNAAAVSTETLNQVLQSAALH